MTSPVLDALARTASRRFQSFSEAATSVLDLVHAAAPGERVALAQIDWEEGTCRMIDSRGDDGSVRGVIVPLAGAFPSSNGMDAGGLIDPAALGALGFGRCSAAPLDASDGSTVGLLLATGDGPHLPLLPVAARLLSYEWESISTRAELRRLSELARDRERTDPVTGLANRRTMLEAVGREWELGKRGTVMSYLVVCRIAGRDALRERAGEAGADLLLKDVSEVLAGGVRRTDHLGRVDDDLLAVVLVGCALEVGAQAFVARCERALAGVTAGRPAPIELAYGFQALANAETGEEALASAEQLAREAEARPAAAPSEEAA
ncbi:MAG TPA: diguanylate cyclase [Thermoleophilaceae bacterium]|nr:diguanylate cyclase [Thermoleophilaceae bacterium]